MKKIILACVVVCFFSGCFVTRMFQKKEKLGCPGDARNMSEQQINDRTNKTKYKSKRKIY